jgi:hypothetical protein
MWAGRWTDTQTDITKLVVDFHNFEKKSLRSTKEKAASSLQLTTYSYEPLRTVRPIYRTGVPLPSRCCILYIFSTNISTEYFKHAALSLFFSSKCRLFHNATFFGSVLFTFYIQDVLKFKCKIPVPKG